jgi:hypothetical protein
LVRPYLASTGPTCSSRALLEATVPALINGVVHQRPAVLAAVGAIGHRLRKVGLETRSEMLATTMLTRR